MIFHTPGQWWDRRRFASLIPSGCRLTPIHKVMGDHASGGSTTARAFMKWGCDVFLWTKLKMTLPNFRFWNFHSFYSYYFCMF